MTTETLMRVATVILGTNVVVTGVVLFGGTAREDLGLHACPVATGSRRLFSLSFGRLDISIEGSKA